MTPFLLRFSDPIPPQPAIGLRYDAVLQLSLIESDGRWVEAVTQTVSMQHTRETRVRSETTDDN